MTAVTQTLQKHGPAMKAKGIRMVSLMVPNPPKWPRQYGFHQNDGYAEDPQRRHIYPTMYSLIELDRLNVWQPERLPSISRNSVVLLGTTGTKPRQQQRVFVRGITHSDGLSEPNAAETALQKAMDELQLAVLDQWVSPSASSHLFLHILSPFAETPEEVINKWSELMANLISKYATRLLKLRVDEIEVRAHTTAADGSRQAVRLVASSMAGQWLKTDGYLEYLDPVSGSTQAYCTLGDGAEAKDLCFMEPYPVSSALSSKRSVARRIGTTYAYDFLGLFEKALIKDWQVAIAEGRCERMPANLFEVDELLLDSAGLIEKGYRVVGTNAVGMVGWHATLKTPEYPEGRPLVIIANDCTVQSGSFGVKEDDFFYAVSKYARAAGIPRVHIACNSGARIGLAEELKPHFKVAWNEPSNEGAGFKYLYLEPAEAERLGAGTNFHGELITDQGEQRYRLEDIVGEKDGLGVENLRGSGLIAGETSAAFAETFTLSYVTGRSVGIGAYINRLASRVIQMQNGPMILTGYSALNKLLGKELYTSQDQLGGPQIMLPNGIAHQLAADDPDGVEKILRWLSYVPCLASEQVVEAPCADPPARDVAWTPPPTPYNPRHMLAGGPDGDGIWRNGFFDKGSFTEYASRSRLASYLGEVYLRRRAPLPQVPSRLGQVGRSRPRAARRHPDGRDRSGDSSGRAGHPNLILT